MITGSHRTSKVNVQWNPYAYGECFACHKATGYLTNIRFLLQSYRMSYLKKEIMRINSQPSVNAGSLMTNMIWTEKYRQSRHCDP